jgi:hypothetical protein
MVNLSLSKKPTGKPVGPLEPDWRQDVYSPPARFSAISKTEEGPGANLDAPGPSWGAASWE